MLISRLHGSYLLGSNANVERSDGAVTAVVTIYPTWCLHYFGHDINDIIATNPVTCRNVINYINTLRMDAPHAIIIIANVHLNQPNTISVCK